MASTGRGDTRRDTTVATCPECDGERDKPGEVEIEVDPCRLGAEHQHFGPDYVPPTRYETCPEPFHSEAQDDRRWVLIRYLQPRTAGLPDVGRNGPHLCPGKAVEVMPVAEHERLMGEKQVEAERLVWEVGRSAAKHRDEAVSERTAEIVAALREEAGRVDDGTDTRRILRIDLRYAADSILSRFGSRGVGGNARG